MTAIHELIAKAEELLQTAQHFVQQVSDYLHHRL